MKHANGQLPRYSPAMVTDLAAALKRISNKTGPQGLRLSFEWLSDVLDDDEDLAERVLRAAGFEPPQATEWTTGAGGRTLASVTYTPILADELTDILDEHD
ncbi:hypothetical protein [uncultured Roseovarius sp.]|uniref:hypothetical protein n=1 Tax=uncultured Roseovarius sp. TaxID=293344 RepID=UPI0025987183|nr:hypothetical protein [uncultured Roseovarius sp.]